MRDARGGRLAARWYRHLGDTVANLNRSNIVSATERTTARQRVAVPARLTWKDQGGAVRFASVTTRDVSDGGAFVECHDATLPLFRLVHLQIEAPLAQAPAAGASGRVLAAVWRIERQDSTGAAQGYALRFLVDPAERAAQRPAAYAAAPRMAVAS